MPGSGRFVSDQAGYVATRRYAKASSEGRGGGRGRERAAAEMFRLPTPRPLGRSQICVGFGHKTDAHDTPAVAVGGVPCRQSAGAAMRGGLDALRMLVDGRRGSDSGCFIAELVRSSSTKPSGGVAAPSPLTGRRNDCT